MSRLLHISALVLGLPALIGAAAPSSNCVPLTIPLTVTANNSVWDIQRVDNTIDVVDWVWDVDTWSHANKSRELGKVSITAEFNISAALCVPEGGAKSDILLLASHGVGFDKK